ncbi:MAG: fibronectin type III domain-containing protein [Spirochaetales bacterium]|nr:fibronectin type III domain-containing protein [Spirochaetales bacterium]
MKKIMFAFLTMVIFFSGCQKDIDAPVVSKKQVSVVIDSADSCLISWEAATDSVTVQDNLLYKAVLTDSNSLSVDELDSVSASQLLLDWKVATLSAVAKGLDAKNIYYIHVFVKDEAGNISTYTSRQVRLNDKPPVVGSAGIVVASAIDYSSLTLSWEPASDGETLPANLKYKILKSTLYYENIDEIKNLEDVVLSWSDGIDHYSVSGLNSDTLYYFYILVKDEAENLAIYVPCPATTKNKAPVAGTTTIKNLVDNSLTLEWSLASDDSSAQELVYKVVKSFFSITSVELANSADEVLGWTANKSSLDISGLEYDQEIYLNVLVRDRRGEIALYSQSSVRIESGAPVAGAGGEITSSNLTGSSVTIGWKSASSDSYSSNQLAYKIVFSSSPISSVAVAEGLERGNILSDWTLNSGDIVDFSFDISGLDYGTKYFFNIIVKDPADIKALYSQLEVITVDNPPVVGNSGIITSSDITADSVKLSWALASDLELDDAELEYKLVKSATPIEDIDQANSFSGDNLVFDWSKNISEAIVAHLSSNTTYYFNVLVRDDSANYALYSGISEITKDTAPVPGNSGVLTSSEVASGSFVLNWSLAIDDVTSQEDLQYKVVISSTPTLDTVEAIDDIETIEDGLILYWEDNELLTIDGQNASLIISNLRYNTTYYLNVMVKDINSNKGLYHQLSVTTENVDDLTAPDVTSAEIFLQSVDTSSASISWSKATDDYTWQDDLEYKAVYSLDPIGSLEIAQSLPAESTLVDWAKGVSQASVSGLTSPNYYFNVLVRDEKGNIALYNQLAVSTQVEYAFNAWEIDTFTSVFSTGHKNNLGPKLGVKGDPKTSIVITYVTKEVKTEATLYFGDDPSNLQYVYPSLKQCEVHHVEISGLKADTEYYYSLSIDTESYIDSQRTKYRANNVLSFKTAPESEIGHSILVLGDQQPKDTGTIEMNSVVARALRERIDQDDIRLVAQVGDVCNMTPTQNARDWEYTLSVLPIFSSKVPQMSVIGNHDGSDPYQYKTIFQYNYPSEISISDDHAYHSMDFGKAHLIFIDSNGTLTSYDGIMENQQKAWIEQDIQSAIARGQEWIFMYFHLAMLCNGADPDMGMKSSSGGKGQADLQEYIIPLATKYKIDAIFWGHDHLYEHWQYEYGANGYFFKNDTERIVAESPIMMFETGGGGAVSEWSWSGIRADNKDETKQWYNTASSSVVSVEARQNSWNTSKYFAATDSSYFGTTFNWISDWGKAGYSESQFYYHFPFELDNMGNVVYEDGKKKYSTNDGISYSTDNQWYGYQYGETTPQYMEIHFNPDGTATITARYPNHKILGDRPGVLPPEAKQEFVIQKKSR